MGKVNAQFTTTLPPAYPGGNRPGENERVAVSGPLDDAVRSRVERTSLAYVFLSFFVLIYWARPNWWIPGTAGIPFAKIAGFLAIASFFLWFLFERRGALSLPREMVYLLLLYLQLCVAIPFSTWRGGSFDLVVLEYSKVVIVTLIATMTITSLTRLRRLVFIQTATITLITALAVAGYGNRVNSAYGQRLGGMFGGTYDNPNDFAFDLALVFPLAFAYLLTTRKLVWKAFWFLSMGLMIYGVLATYSRGGLLALLAGVGVAMWEFAVKGRRPHWILLLVVSAAAVFILSGPEGYSQRVATIFHPEEDISGSAQDRRALFERGLSLTARYPLWGIGPGNFQVVSGSSEAHDWHGTHNTYLQLSSEAGVPALILFLLVLKLTFSNVRRAKKLAIGDKRLTLLAGGLRASLVSLVVGAFFADVAYHFFPYFLVAFSSALAHIAQTTASGEQSLPQANHATGDDVKAKTAEGSQRWLGLGRVSPS